MKTITKPLALTAAIAVSLAAAASAAPTAAADAFTVLRLEQAPSHLDASAVAAQLQALDVDALTIGNVVRAADTMDTALAPDPLAALADQLGYTYRFVSADPAAAEQRGSVVLSRLPVEAESGVEAPGLNYLRLNDGRHVVALYTRAADSDAEGTPLKALVDGSRLGAPAVLLGADAETATTAGFAAVTRDAVYSAGFNAATAKQVKLRLDADSSIGGELVTLGYSAPLGGDTPWMDTGLGADARAKLLVARMTVDEKFQMLHSYFGLGKDGGPLPEGAVGSAGFVPGVPRLGIPAQQSADAGVGVTNPGGIRKGDIATAMPSGPSTASTWNPQIAFTGGATMGREAWQQRFNILLAGSVNLQRDPRNGRNFEYAGEDPLLAGRLVGESIRGVQSQHVISTMKHFALNDMETSRNFHSAEIGEQAMRESDLLAFEIAMAEGKPGSVMCSYNRINGTYGCEHDYLMNQVLKQEWKFPGFVMSDWGGVHSGSKAALAGLDQQSAGEVFDKAVYFDQPLRLAVAGGVVPQARLDDMVTRILRTMFAHGNFDLPPQHVPIDVEAGFAAAQRTVEEGSVLLRNENSLLPLGRDVQRIVVIGGHADKGVIGGGGSSHVGFTARGTNAVPGVLPTTWPGPVIFHPSSPLQALRAERPEASIEYVDGRDVAAAARAAAAADVAIVFATQWSAESVDLPHMRLPDNQDALIAGVAKANPKTVVVLETGGPVLTPWRGQVAGILAAWYPGTQGGTAIANLLFGKVNPSGHLPATFPASLDQLAKPSTPNKGDTTYSEGATVGYKWYDAKGLAPAFPFGHGLSYTEFGYSGLSARADDGTVSASFTVRNTGKVKGKAVPQLYVAGTGWEAPKRLGGFTKVELAPGEAKTVTLKVDPRLLATFDGASNSWKIAGGTVQVMLGTSAKDIVATVPVTLQARTIAVGWRP